MGKRIIKGKGALKWCGGTVAAKYNIMCETVIQDMDILCRKRRVANDVKPDRRLCL